ncbi:MAG: hypothetical protein A3J59_04975 [Candidatus Buchananbacteria bacterium RIFCSPHIGHO2_02_FULL_56_16]|uniref:6-phosphogluconate dehydrogenase (Decarboxylating) n=1 Tax=Candidatus Buchananbacteria bacterium RIFCSPHIGHO2_02_FULL_56_16 TaxID=1797542 RepID=A0A1G1YIW3_9BACT|nr:MAG: hypothetical protein A3J59_04975 [Candidatus Buchananbacteria bacterium RIFCSPHIGHO2_02_FULL_56_16]
MSKIGFYGLGRMGYGMVSRLLSRKVAVVAFNRGQDKVKQISRQGAIPVASLEELVGKLGQKKIIWLMLPSGKPTDAAIKKLLPLLRRGDIIIDGANDFYQNAEMHAKLCAKKGVYFFDVGVSGGVWGLKNGYTLMVGGPKSQFKFIEPFCQALAPKGGYGYFGETGSGHFVKSVHNIVEYVYLQGLAEGVEALSRFKKPIDLRQVTKVWQPASVVHSWLLGLTTKALERPDFKKISPKIDSVTIDELRKTVAAVKAYAPAFSAAVAVRRDQTKKFALGKRTIAAIRREFGGHEVRKGR